MSLAMTGLIEAADSGNFDPAKGRFKTFAWKSMRGAISKGLRDGFSLVKISGSEKQTRLFFNLSREKAKRNIYRASGLTEAEAASIAKSLSTQRLHISAADVMAVECRLSGGGDRSFDAPLGEDREGNEVTLYDYFADEQPGPENALLRAEETTNQGKALASAIDQLSERERRIFEARVLAENPVGLHDLGKALDLSGERVRQIEAATTVKVKAAVVEYLNRIEVERPRQAPATTINDGLDPWRRYRMLIDMNVSPETAMALVVGSAGQGGRCYGRRDRPWRKLRMLRTCSLTRGGKSSPSLPGNAMWALASQYPSISGIPTIYPQILGLRQRGCGLPRPRMPAGESQRKREPTMAPVCFC